MRVVILSKALVAGAYQRKLEAIARLGVELTALVPHSWREPRVGVQRLERRFTSGYQLVALPMAFNGQHHIHFYPTLAHHLRRLRPEVLHIDEESFNLATFHAMRIGLKLGARCCFYNWANIDRRYPPPFSFFERYNLRHAAHAIAGNQEAATIIRRHGYQGPISVIPQFGVDPEMFAQVASGTESNPFTIGYLGRLVPEKGVLDLIEALAGLPAHIHLRLVGDGVLRAQIEERVVALGLGERVVLRPAVGSTAVPAVMADLDLLVLPSHTTANWKEQFGRVLIEAMSCGVPVLGSNSGEIPHVIGAAGLIFPEGDPDGLRRTILQVAEHPQLRHDLAQRGRARVLEHFTQAAVARRHVEVYREMLGNGSHIP
ncbi:glycosyltransferase family 4 protein [Candidatus Oscillochloris fontis]|uniref:glycosyltransferase family 4 protein n=1 Tax=Candidatus Oscillochloris fontis TaxID=2496868 RepID=UPI00101D4977|nr:glycosyltransferase family 4 protein [Candidatus Oscillochloris fontis]